VFRQAARSVLDQAKVVEKAAQLFRELNAKDTTATGYARRELTIKKAADDATECRSKIGFVARLGLQRVYVGASHP